MRKRNRLFLEKREPEFTGVFSPGGSQAWIPLGRWTRGGCQEHKTRKAQIILPLWLGAQSAGLCSVAAFWSNGKKNGERNRCVTDVLNECTLKLSNATMYQDGESAC